MQRDLAAHGTLGGNKNNSGEEARAAVGSCGAKGTAGLTDGTSDTTSEVALAAAKPLASGLI